MPVSKYPRSGQRLAPRTLQEILNVPAVLAGVDPRGGDFAPSLSQLDESVWTHHDPATCEGLARQVIEQVRQALLVPNPELSHRRIPQLPEGIGLDDLELETRTRNALAEEGYEEHPEDLLKLNIGELLEVPGFGARSLVDLLTALEEFDINVVRYPWASRRFAEILDYEVRNLLANPNLSLIHADDPRFVEVFEHVRGLLNRPAFSPNLRSLAEAVQSQIAELKRPVELITALQQLRIKLDSMASLTLEEELLDVIPTRGVSERNRMILYLRLGWDGAGPRTLQTVANEFGLTREAVRKICSQLLRQIGQKQPFTPTLNRALTLLSKSLPSTTSGIEDSLQKDGYTRGRFTVGSLVSAAQILGWEAAVAVEAVNGQSYALRAGQADTLGLITTTAKEAVTHWGMANVGDLAAKVAAKTGVALDTHFVVQVLGSLDDLRWLDAVGGWFWLPSVRHNRLLTQVRKMMAVAHQLEVGDLRRGIARHHRMIGFAPPSDVLLELCRQQPLYTVQGNVVIADESLRWQDVLGPAERLMVEVLLQAGGVMGVDEFEDRCRTLGVKESTFFTYLDYSPLLTKHARRTFGLRGTVLPKDAQAPPRPRRRPQRVLLAQGRDTHGRVWLRYALSRPAVAGGIVAVLKAEGYI
ncbi:MAG: hypothetical protein M1337_06765 [Actinobacteria bacterium]|nr:hypothetical protein [Actinomycetota bacterium]